MEHTYRVRHRSSGFRFTADRTAVAAAIVVVCVVLAVQGGAFRSLEAATAAWWLTPFLPPIAAVGDQIVFGLDGAESVSLQITSECTAGLLIIPVLLPLAFLAVHRRTALARVVAAALVAAGGLFVVNQLRIGLIAGSVKAWGIDPGYEVSHVLVGSVLSVVGFVAALLIALRIVGVAPRRR